MKTTPNAVKAQRWIAVIVFVLTVTPKHRPQLRQDWNEGLQTLSVTLLEKTPAFQLFAETRGANKIDPFCNQLSLFELRPDNSDSAIQVPYGE